jgi:hypothetical protein
MTEDRSERISGENKSRWVKLEESGKTRARPAPPKLSADKRPNLHAPAPPPPAPLQRTPRPPSTEIPKEKT